MSIKSIDIEILGRDLQVNCPEELSAELQYISGIFNDRLNNFKKKTKGFTNNENLIFITALNVFYDLNKEKKEMLKKIKIIEKKIILLTKFLDGVTENIKKD